MGLFNFFKSKKTNRSECSRTEESIKLNTKSPGKEEDKYILSKLGINPYDFNHEEMSPCNISLKEELTGAIRISDWSSVNNDIEFDYINLTDNIDGSKSLYLAQNNRGVGELKVLINKFYKELGETRYLGAEFKKNDLIEMNQSSSGELREWYLDNFKIVIGYNYNPNLTSNYILVEEQIQ